MAGDPNDRGWLSAVVADVTGDRFDDVVLGNGKGLPAFVRSVSGYTGVVGPAMTVMGDAPSVRRFAEEPNNLPAHLLTAPFFRAPTLPNIAVLPKHRFTANTNEIGFYRVDDASGRVGGLSPGDAGYATAALAADRRLPFDDAGRFAAALPVGGWFGHYLIPEGGDRPYFSHPAANAGDTFAFRYIPKRNRFAWKDHSRSDDDANDFIAELRAGTAGRVVMDPPPNTPPTISDIADLTREVGSLIASLPFVIGDKETAAGQLAVTVTSSDTTLLPPSSLVLGGIGANRTLQLVPVTGLNGAATVTVTVSDGQLSATDTFRLIVVPPTVTVPPITPFPNDLSGWTVAERSGTPTRRGAVSLKTGQATMAEGDSFVTTLSRSFVVLANPIRRTSSSPTPG